MSAGAMEALRQRFCVRALDEADQLEAALATNDRARLESLAHSLSGTAGLFGYGGISTTAAFLDKAFAGGDADALQGVPALIAAIRRDMADYS